MKRADLLDLLCLAALWGSSFLFMRLATAEFGPAALAMVRVAGATLILLPVLLWRGESGVMLKNWRAIAVVGLTNSAVPFLLFNYAALSIGAGLLSIFNVATPLFGALIAGLWLKERLSGSQLLGLAVGLLGVVGLAWNSASFSVNSQGHSGVLAVLACLSASAFYGFSVNYMRKTLASVPPVALTVGSQFAASLALAPAAWWWWPAQTPGATAIGAALALALLCTGLAYLLFFRLVAHVGPTQAISVTFLIPAFAVLWGVLFLGETVSLAMFTGCAVILLGTALVTQVLRLPGRRRAA